jgi:hypothetical protein
VTTGHVYVIETRRSLRTPQPTPFTTCRVDAWSLGYQEGRRHGGQRISPRRHAGVNPPLNPTRHHTLPLLMQAGMRFCVNPYPNLEKPL